MKLKSEICKSFNHQAESYEKAAKVQAEIGKRLISRLDYMNIQPRRVLDLGCGTGVFSLLLKKRYPSATIVSFDLAENMLLQTRKKQGWLSKWPLIRGDMLQMPFASQSFDLVFSNQCLHWAASLSGVYSEIYRIMNEGACLIFSTLGPDTFLELRKAWAKVDNYAHANDFVDMHDIGDCLLKQHFVDPVMDMERLTLHYRHPKDILVALKRQGVKNIHAERPRGLMGKSAWQAFYAAYEDLQTSSGQYPLSYEVLYGHAWKFAKNQTTGQGETFIPVSAIQRKTAK